MSTAVQAILDNRSTIYGDFNSNINACASIICVLNIPQHNHQVRHLLDIYVTKLVRLAVTPGHIDSHIDIAGYTKLILGIDYEPFNLTEPQEGLETRVAKVPEIMGTLEGLYKFNRDANYNSNDYKILEKYVTYLVQLFLDEGREFLHLTQVHALAAVRHYEAMITMRLMEASND